MDKRAMILVGGKGMRVVLPKPLMPICEYPILEIITSELGLYGFGNLMYDLLKYNKKAYAESFEGYWLDIGRTDDCIQAIDEYDKMKEKFFK